MAATEITRGRKALLSRVVEQLGEAPHDRVETEEYTVFRMSAPTGADYTFSVWVYEDAEPQITAGLVGAPDNEVFWGRSFELADYPTSCSRDDDFLRVLSLILSCRTRISEHRGALLTTYDCDVDMAGEWESVGGNSAGRWMAGARRGGGERVEHLSPRLCGP